MALAALFGTLRRLVVRLSLVLLALMFLPGLPPSEIEHISLPLKPNRPFEGPLAVNDGLNAAQILTVHRSHHKLRYFKGPESFAFRDGYLYTGILGGDILRLDISSNTSEPFIIKEDGIEGGKDWPGRIVPRKDWKEWQKIAETSNVNCSGQEHDEANCGRPLGMAFMPGDQADLLVCDAVHGLLRVDISSGKTSTLVSPHHKIDGLSNYFMNSVAVSRDGSKAYFTASSSYFGLTDAIYECLSAGSGRLLSYDFSSGKVNVLASGLAFANGVALSPKEDFILVAESTRFRIWKHWLAGPEKGQTELWSEVPGSPDNIRSNGKGGYLVGLFSPHHPDDKIMLTKRVLASPPLSRAIVRFMRLSQMMMEFLDSWQESLFAPWKRHKNSPHGYWWLLGLPGLAAHHLGHIEHSTSPFVKKYGLLLEMDAQGEILQSWHSPNGALPKVSEGYLHSDGWIYLGSPQNLFVARVRYKESP